MNSDDKQNKERGPLAACEALGQKRVSRIGAEEKLHVKGQALIDDGGFGGSLIRRL